jgi:NAD+ synthetase
MRFALAQVNTRVGDIQRNVERILASLRDAASAGADVVVFPELTVPGYPPNDALERVSFVRENIEAVKTLADATRGLSLHALVGFVDVNREAFGKPVYNAVAQLHRGEVVDIFYKTLLPTYDVFDEQRYFKANGLLRAGAFGDRRRFAPLLCEDLWYETRRGGCFLYDTNPLEALMLQGVDVIVNLSASPFSLTKAEQRLDVASRAARRYDRPVIYTNLVGMNEGLVFDGGSFVMGRRGKVLAQARWFEEDLLLWDDGDDAKPAPKARAPKVSKAPTAPEASYRAAVLGIRDFFDKTRQQPLAVLGLSGGIDSALVAAMAVEALGPERVVAATLPSAISSRGSVTDSQALARRLGLRLFKLPIARSVAALRTALAPAFGDLPEDVTEENLQARVRGTLLMALANKLGGTVLNTGNKSELAVGYCTMYGDLIGGLSPLGDLYKTEVYEVARWYNRTHRGKGIPKAVIEKAPSAELRPGQTDQDDLPPYPVLDAILQRFLEHEAAADEISAQIGAPLELVERVLRLTTRNEFKRRQAPPVLRLHERAFGSGWRYPIMGRFPG